MVFLNRTVEFVSKFCDWIAQVAVMAMLLLVVGNIILRKVWKPIHGTYDYVCFLGAIMVSLAIAYCAVRKGHIEVELLMVRFSDRVQGIVGIFTNILSLAIFSLITWQCMVLAGEMRRAGEVSMTALIPFYPYIYVVSFGCILLCMVILFDLIKSFSKAVKK
ncbi:MAG: TRAP transporter small permease [Deltaproteobacteria bacterium]|nr:TRAP transporter small permease [Deltaproteobacteria bacterium]